MNIKKKHLGKMITAVLCFAFAAGITGMTAFSADSSNDTEFLVSAYESAEYTVNIQLLQFGSDELSMGNASMIPEAHIVVSDDGTAQLEIDMVSLTYLGQEGYLGWMKKVTNVIETNRFNYPLEFETEDSLVLEQYIDVFDIFNNPESEYCDAAVEGKWYPKKLAFPVDFANREDEMLVQVYVPVMESIQTGGGTKFAVVDIDWDTLTADEAYIPVTTEPAETTTTAPTTEDQTIVTTTTTAALESEPVQTTTTTVIESNTAELDIHNLPDGKYEMYAEMIKTDRISYSMSNEGINHTVQLEVVDGEYYLTVQFKGLAIYNQFGYLMDLYYYNSGYTYNNYGAPEGEVTQAEVLSTYNVVDEYNDADHLYPELLKFKLVDKASGEYVPLRVFVPIMEAISEGTGTQNVLMKLDWTKLVKTESDFELEQQEEQSPEFDYTDEVTGIVIHADRGVLAETVTGKVTELTEGEVYSSAKTALADVSQKFKVYDIELLTEDGTDAELNGKIQISIPVPSDYSNPVVYRVKDGKKTMISGTAADGVFTFSAKEAGVYVIAEKAGQSSVSANKNTASPQTGDNTPIGAVTALVAASACAMILTRKRKVK